LCVVRSMSTCLIASLGMPLRLATIRPDEDSQTFQVAHLKMHEMATDRLSRFRGIAKISDGASPNITCDQGLEDGDSTRQARRRGCLFLFYLSDAPTDPVLSSTQISKSGTIRPVQPVKAHLKVAIHCKRSIARFC
jgi:hypothetical protein